MIRRQFLLSSLCFGGTGLTAAIVVPSSLAVASEAKKKGGGEGYTQFPTISVFTQAGRRTHGTLSVDMGLYCADPKFSDTIKLYMPRLRDAYLLRLQNYAGGLSASSLVDTDYISSQLQSATDQVLGRQGAKVLLGAILLN